MSYEPTLIILKTSIDKHMDLLINGTWQFNIKDDAHRGEDGLTVMEYLQYVCKNDKPIKIGGIELYLTTPCFTTFNQEVRKKLHDLNIEFTVSY